MVGPATRNLWGIWEGCYAPQLRCFAACSGFLMVGPASRNLWGDGRFVIPTAALLRSLQWVSDGRSRDAEPMGRWEVCYAPQRRCFAACSGFLMVGPASRNLWGCGGIARPTAALLCSLQWVSDSRSRYAEPVGCDGRWLCHV